jgi:hypothetical protein
VINYGSKENIASKYLARGKKSQHNYRTKTWDQPSLEGPKTLLRMTDPGLEHMVARGSARSGTFKTQTAQTLVNQNKKNKRKQRAEPRVLWPVRSSRTSHDPTRVETRPDPHGHSAMWRFFVNASLAKMRGACDGAGVLVSQFWLGFTPVNR